MSTNKTGAVVKRKILISSCLLGEAVRYDGGQNRVANTMVDTWIAEDRVIPVCPEVAGGLPVPRAACEIKGIGGGETVLRCQALVETADGTDRTNEFVRGAEVALALARQHDVLCAILKERSPSCGSEFIYDGSFTKKKISGAGVTAALLTQNGFQVFSEENLEAAIRFVAASD